MSGMEFKHPTKRGAHWVELETDMTDKITPEAVERMLDGVSPAPWLPRNMVHADGRAMTPEEIGEYVTNSVKIGTQDQFLFVMGQHDDGGDADICHAGNGPRGPANTAFIAWAREAVPALATRLAEVEADLGTAQELIAILEGEQARAEAAEARAAELDAREDALVRAALLETRGYTWSGVEALANDPEAVAAIRASVPRTTEEARAQKQDDAAFAQYRRGFTGGV
jgi:hypothetical protein